MVPALQVLIEQWMFIDQLRAPFCGSMDRGQVLQMIPGVRLVAAF